MFFFVKYSEIRIKIKQMWLDSFSPMFQRKSSPLDLFIIFMFWTVNFSYPSLEEPKPLTPPQPEPEVRPEPLEPSAPVLVNGVAPAEPPTSKTSVVTDRLPDTLDSPVTGSANSGLDLNKKDPAVSSQSPATAKAFPQVLLLP